MRGAECEDKTETDLFDEIDLPVIDEDDGNQRQDHEDYSHVQFEVLISILVQLSKRSSGCMKGQKEETHVIDNRQSVCGMEGHGEGE